MQTMSRRSCIRASPSLRNRQRSCTDSRRTTTTSSPRWLCVPSTAAGWAFCKSSTRAWAMGPLLREKLSEEAALLVVSHPRRLLDRVEHVALRLDLLLQDLETVEDLLGTRRAARHVDVDGDDPVRPLHGRVVVVEAARRGADAERHYPLRLAHLLVDAPQDGRLLHVDGAHDHEQVGLPRREARELGAEAGEIVSPAHHAHVLHAAAGGDERVLEERVGPRPAERAGDLLLEPPDRVLAAGEQDGDCQGVLAEPRVRPG